ncbi:MAG: hypothetical protein RLZZ116_1295 [Planctomycetota bacterium]
MARRLTVFLLACAALFGSLLGPTLSTARAQSETVQSRGCCGDDCRCAETCPCVAKDERGAPSGEAPLVPAPTRDQRAFLLHLPALAATLLSDLPPTGRIALTEARPSAHARSGREILAIVSRWTT